VCSTASAECIMSSLKKIKEHRRFILIEIIKMYTAYVTSKEQWKRTKRFNIHYKLSFILIVIRFNNNNVYFVFLLLIVSIHLYCKFCILIFCNYIVMKLIFLCILVLISMLCCLASLLVGSSL